MGWGPPSCLPESRLLLLQLLTLLLVMAGRCESCRVEQCSSEYGNHENLQDFKASPESCKLAYAYLRCLRETARSCRGDINFHFAFSWLEKLITHNNCAALLRTTPAAAAAASNEAAWAPPPSTSSAPPPPPSASALRVARPAPLPPLRPVRRPAPQDVRQRVPDVPRARRLAAHRQPLPRRAGHQRARRRGLPRHRHHQGDGDRARQGHDVHPGEDVRGAVGRAAALRLHRRHAAVGARPDRAADDPRRRRARRDLRAAHRVPRHRAQVGPLPRSGRAAA